MNEQVEWTKKLPSLIAGLVLLFIGLVALMRHWSIVALVAVLLGAGFIGYSLTIKDWCAVKGTTMGQSAWGQSGFGGGIGDCVRAKGWWSF